MNATAAGATMRAAVRDRYGPPDVVEVREVERPVPADDEVLVRVCAASLNMADWYTMAGRPYVARVAAGLRRPKTARLGIDFAGVVEAIGRDVTHVAVGDEVFGGRDGAFAELVTVRKAVARKPASLSFEQAAAVPVAGVTALQALRDKGGLEAGQRVLVNGASGGVGVFAVQVARALGAEVTAVCSTRNVEQTRSIGADHVVDYTREDFTRGDRRYDLVIDVAGGRPWSHLRRVLEPGATVVVVGAPRGGGLLGPIGHVARLRVASLAGGRKAVFFVARLTRDDLETLSAMIETGTVTPLIDRTYPLEDVSEAFRYLGEGHCRSKTVLTM